MVWSEVDKGFFITLFSLKLNFSLLVLLSFVRAIPGFAISNSLDERDLLPKDLLPKDLLPEDEVEEIDENTLLRVLYMLEELLLCLALDSKLRNVPFLGDLLEGGVVADGVGGAFSSMLVRSVFTLAIFSTNVETAQPSLS